LNQLCKPMLALSKKRGVGLSLPLILHLILIVLPLKCVGI